MRDAVKCASLICLRTLFLSVSVSLLRMLLSSHTQTHTHSCPTSAERSGAFNPFYLPEQLITFLSPFIFSIICDIYLCRHHTMLTLVKLCRQEKKEGENIGQWKGMMAEPGCSKLHSNGAVWVFGVRRKEVFKFHFACLSNAT